MSVCREAWAGIVLPLAVTNLLRRRPSHGYELVQRLDTAGFTGVGGGTLYPLLHRLERGGAVSWTWEHPSAGPARKRYALTESGQALVDQLTNDWHSMSSHIEIFLREKGRSAT
ncbi:PadR family transcriptional regulator [Frondihabitans sp. VKM Ac-2883]|uniref:PadR family transcriptional regulator n=1 Tax=Frondihabitans sp. VKM Ac-2883 TaxID=2783823 RepID=UPI00351C099C